jgi:hypothetical protein
MRRPPVAALLLSAAVAVGVQAQDSLVPALERQLSADRVPPGSALEALIQDNQDFERLRPEELRDSEEVPPWLKVLWRKSHPEGAYSAADPTGGYPLALKEIHEWMVTHPDLRPGRRERAVPPSKAAASTSPNVRVSGSSPVPRSESDIRVNYRDPRKIIAAANNIGGSGSQAQFWSTDGGATWGRTILPLAPGDSFQTDPTVEWTSDGTAWATTIGVGARGLVTRIRSYRSQDGGATWTLDGLISGTQTSADKQQVWVDHGDTSPYKDTIYAVWHNAGPVFVNRRRPGRAWEKPVPVSGRQTGSGIGGDVKTNSAGVVFALWPNTVSRKIQMVRSTNGGATWSAPLTVASTIDSFDIGIPAQSRRRALVYVSAGAFRRGTRNLVYAAWTDLNSTTCKTGSTAPAVTACKTRVWFTRSLDAGRTWAPPRPVNDAHTVNDQFNQAMVVDESTGALALVYYDTAGDPGRRRAGLWYQSSHDDGATWAEPFKVTTMPSDETASGAEFGNQFGDYNGLSGWAGTFFPSWTDRRSGGREEIWTAPLVDPFDP